MWGLGTSYTFNLSVAETNSSGATFNASLRDDRTQVRNDLPAFFPVKKDELPTQARDGRT